MSSRKVRAFGLLYGDYFDLHKTTIDQLRRPEFRTTVWCNQVCDQTMDYLIKHRVTMIVSDDNRPKFQAMRVLFKTEIDPDPNTWILWMDDDNKFVGPWLEHAFWMMDFYKNRNPVCLAPYRVHEWTPTELNVIYESRSYKGREVTKPISYPMGGYFWLRSDVIRRLDLPDDFLSHNSTDTPGGISGDWALGMALYQNNYEILNCSEGVIVNSHSRRGIGSNLKDDTRAGIVVP